MMESYNINYQANTHQINKMKGKTEFKKFEVKEIRKLISQKLIASRNDQKSIRSKIGSFDFYFSDFSSKKGFTVQDFNNLIKSGKIKIIGKKKFKYIPVRKEQLKNPQSSTSKNQDIANGLIVNGKFSSIKDLDQSVLNSTGFYCIKLKTNSRLPDRYKSILDKRKNRFNWSEPAKRYPFII